MKPLKINTILLLICMAIPWSLLPQQIIGYSDLCTYNTLENLIVADFSANQTVINTGETIQFTDLSGGTTTPVSWSWNFGDGTQISTQQHPTHIFKSPVSIM